MDGTDRPLLIALDYDGTFTADPPLWRNFIALCQRRGHKVVCVTMRYEREAVDNMPAPVIYTGRKAKIPFMQALGRHVDIWIDDMPHFVVADALA